MRNEAEVARAGSPAEELRRAFWRLKESRIRVFPAHTTRASSIGDPCERRLFYARTAGELAAPHEASLQAIFDLGKELENFVIHELEAMGVEVTQRERDYADRELELTAHADARIRLPGWPKAVTAEVKGLAAGTIESIETIEDIRNARQPYVRKYYSQLQAYLFFDQGDLGIFVLLNKQSGQITFIECPRDQAHIDLLLAKAARIRDAVREKKEPPRYETSDCERCAFQAVCMPDRLAGEGTQILAGQAAFDASELIARRMELAGARAEVDSIDRQLKRLLPETEELVVGDFLVKAKKVERAGFTVKPAVYWNREYTRIGG